MQERPSGNIRPTHVHHRGEFLQPKDRVKGGTPAVLHAMPSTPNGSRLALAEWIVDPANPLTGRVIVNRHWAAIFGTGIVRTVDDFGLQGEFPSHPDLLDWLAQDVVSHGWSLKRLHALILTSATWRQSSVVRPELLADDPQNSLLARQQRLRLEAEIIRDSILSVSNLLDARIGGPSVFPPQPDGILDGRATPATWTVSEGDDRWRRGMYTWIWRLTPHPHLTLFDGPDGVTACTRRDRSNVPVQALTLLNDPTFLEAARQLGRRTLQLPDADDIRRVNWVFRQCLLRNPSDAERTVLLDLLAAQRRNLTPAQAALIMEESTDERIDDAAWTIVCRALINTDEFITRE